MDILNLLCCVSLAFTGLASGANILPDETYEAVGENLMFTTSVTPTEKPFLVVAWEFINKNNIKINIITSTSTDVINPDYGDRITLIKSTGSLELRNLDFSDSGEYRVSITSDGGALMSGQTRLEVLEPVSSVSVSFSGSDLVEFNSSVSLSCSSSGSSISFLWMNGSSVVVASDRVELTDEGRNLTIKTVTRNDQGPFRCNVSNAVSKPVLSEPVKFSISYGPDNIDLKTSPSKAFYQTGTNISLTCSSVSEPPAQFKWYLNRTQLPDTGPELSLTNIQLDQSGDYSCEAFNSKTLRYQTSQPAAVAVVEPVSSVSVSVSGLDLVEFNSSVSLSCSSSGSSISFLWMNGSSEVKASDRVELSDQNRIVTILTVTRYDQGPFSCKVSNPISDATSDPNSFSISYGPEDVTLKKSPTEDQHEKGANISFSCSSVSEPSAQIKWYLNRTHLSGTGPELRLTNIQLDQSGDYSCEAFNSKTLRYQTSQPAAVAVVDILPSAGCGAGCIAGIVIACVVVAVVVGLVVYFLLIKKKKQSSSQHIVTRTRGEGQDNTASQNQELHYSSIAFKNKQGGAVQLGTNDIETNYAEVQVNRRNASSIPPTYENHMQRVTGRAPQPGANGAHGNQVYRK